MIDYSKLDRTQKKNFIQNFVNKMLTMDDYDAYKFCKKYLVFLEKNVTQNPELKKYISASKKFIETYENEIGE
jgi:hypothetical protein